MAFIDILGPVTKLVDKLIPDPAQRDKAKLELLQMQQNGELKELEISMSAILAEAQSSDKWTSRARPSFLYVCYILILSSIPMGVVFAISPSSAQNVTDGFKAWLSAIPTDIIDLMKIVMLGYIGGRTIEKVRKGA